MALKDWKKTNHYYGEGFAKFGNKEKGFIYIGEDWIKQKPRIFVKIWKAYFGGVSEKPNVKRFFEDGDKALAFAKKYMGEH